MTKYCKELYFTIQYALIHAHSGVACCKGTRFPVMQSFPMTFSICRLSRVKSQFATRVFTPVIYYTRASVATWAAWKEDEIPRSCLEIHADIKCESCIHHHRRDSTIILTVEYPEFFEYLHNVIAVLHARTHTYARIFNRFKYNAALFFWGLLLSRSKWYFELRD